MRALTIDRHGGLDQLRYRDDVHLPAVVAPDQLRVRVTAAALNHLDLFVLAGMPGVSITPPWVLGADGTGVVDEVGSAVRNVVPGDRVVINPGIACRRCEYCVRGEHSMCLKFALLGEHLHGTFAEYVTVPSTNVRRIPAGIDDAVAAAFSLATLTAWRMVVTRARVRAGETVLIQGIGGGVALAALQICRAIGATVWVTSSSDGKLVRAAEFGAERTLNYLRQDVAREVRAGTNRRGADVVIDSGGAASWSASLGALGKGGRLVTCGASSTPLVETDVRRLFWNQWTVMGSTMGNDAEFDAVVAELVAGRLVPPVDAVFSLAEGRLAFERLTRGEQFGKLVLRIG